MRMGSMQSAGEGPKEPCQYSDLLYVISSLVERLGQIE